MPWILNLVARILKFEPLNFYPFRYRMKAMRGNADKSRPYPLILANHVAQTLSKAAMQEGILLYSAGAALHFKAE